MCCVDIIYYNMKILQEMQSKQYDIQQLQENVKGEIFEKLTKIFFDNHEIALTAATKKTWKRILCETKITTYDNFGFSVYASYGVNFEFGAYECSFVDVSDASVLDDSFQFKLCDKNGIEITDNVVMSVQSDVVDKYCSLEDFLKLDDVKK